MDESKNFALVTSASSGIGLAISRELAARGYPLVIVSNEEKITEAAGIIEKEFKVKAIPYCLDLAQSDSAEVLYNYCEENGIKVDVLVNNAGIFFFRDVVNTRAERIGTMIKLHALTPSLLSRFFAEQMIRDKRSGYILNMASIAAWMMMPGITMYSATKSYLRCFSRAMRNEVFKKGVSITTVCPGAVATGLYGLASRYMKIGIKLGIILTPERLARLAVKKMLKKKAEYIPGGILNRLFILIIMALPERLVRRIKRRIDSAINKGL